MVSTLLVTVLELLSLLVLHQFGSTLNVIPSGPVGLGFSLVYQFLRLVPSTYHFCVFGVAFSTKRFLTRSCRVNRPPNLR
jgi:ubiquitin-associated domain-containing protein 2